MQTITITGTVLQDAQSSTDQWGKAFTCILVSCWRKSQIDEPIFTKYRCFVHKKGYEDIRKGDRVCISGELWAGAVISNEKPVPSLSVEAKTIEIVTKKN